MWCHCQRNPQPLSQRLPFKCQTVHPLLESHHLVISLFAFMRVKSNCHVKKKKKGARGDKQSDTMRDVFADIPTAYKLQFHANSEQLAQVPHTVIQFQTRRVGWWIWKPVKDCHLGVWLMLGLFKCTSQRMCHCIKPSFQDTHLSVFMHCVDIQLFCLRLLLRLLLIPYMGIPNKMADLNQRCKVRNKNYKPELWTRVRTERTDYSDNVAHRTTMTNTWQWDTQNFNNDRWNRKQVWAISEACDALRL